MYNVRIVNTLGVVMPCACGCALFCVLDVLALKNEIKVSQNICQGLLLRMPGAEVGKVCCGGGGGVTIIMGHPPDTTVLYI